MAIQETRKKLHFAEFKEVKGSPVDTDPPPVLTITGGKMMFNGKLIKELELEGKFIKLYVDPIKNVIGWQIKDKVSLEGIKNGGWRLVNVSSAGNWIVQIRAMMAQQFGEDKAAKKYDKMPVQKYVDTGSLIGTGNGNIFYFVELVDEVPPEPKKSLLTPVEQSHSREHAHA